MGAKQKLNAKIQPKFTLQFYSSRRRYLFVKNTKTNRTTFIPAAEIDRFDHKILLMDSDLADFGVSKFDGMSVSGFNVDVEKIDHRTVMQEESISEFRFAELEVPKNKMKK